MLKHGQETLVTDFGKNCIVKTPLARAVSKRQDWMARQRSAADTMQKLSEIGNNSYIVPKTEMIDDTNLRIIEERVNGVPLTPLLFRTLNKAQRDSIVDALAQFYNDIHQIRRVENPVKYQMRYGFVVDYLSDFTKHDMRKWFPMSDVKFVQNISRDLSRVEYESRLVWAHNDLFEENILYDARKNKCAIIDFTKSGYSFLHYDIVDSYAKDLGAFDDFRARYASYCDSNRLPSNFTEPEQWNKILNWHCVAQILSDLDENAMDVQISKDLDATVAKMRANVESLRRLWSR